MGSITFSSISYIGTECISNDHLPQAYATLASFFYSIGDVWCSCWPKTL